MRNKIYFGLAVAAGLSAGVAQAAVITLNSVSPSAGNYVFDYTASVGADEGVRTGDSLVIYDFAGYVAGSVFSNNPLITASAQLVTPGLITPGYADDPTMTNLVFHYNGADYQNTGGPYAPFDFTGFGASSTLSHTVLTAFTTMTTKNNPAPAANTAVYTLGTTQAPSGTPEPAAWALMVTGFGLVGAFARRRRPALAA